MQVRKQQLELVMEQQYGVNRYKLLYIKQISNRIYKELYSISSEYIMRNVGLEETQTRIKIARRNIKNFRYADVQRRHWRPTPVPLPGESQGQRSPVGCRLWGRTESDTTEVT